MSRLSPRQLVGPGTPGAALLAAVAVAVAVWFRADPATAAVTVLLGALVGRRRFVLAVAVLSVAGALRSDAAIRSVEPDRLGRYTGWATVALDPDPGPTATRLVVQIEGERFESWVPGRARRLRVARWQQGDIVWVTGERVRLGADRAGRVVWQHVVGGFEFEHLGDVLPGRPLAVAANRVRDLVARGTAVIDAPLDTLARGLIIGDDREQPRDMVERFRRSGLSHLVAVSGQNVCLVVAGAGPLLRRLRTGARLAATIGLIAWFVVLTRAEPSVLRAGAMAALAAIAFALGREREPPRLLAVAVIALLLLDPLLVRSIGFWLSVGATAGVTMLAAPLTRALRSVRPLRRVAMPLAVTLAAQAGVALPSLLVFGRLSVAGTMANLAAVPVAGFVMLYGLPAALVAGLLPAVAPALMLPVDAGVRWVDATARIAATVEPGGIRNIIAWCVVAAVVFVGGWVRVRACENEHVSGVQRAPASVPELER